MGPPAARVPTTAAAAAAAAPAAGQPAPLKIKPKAPGRRSLQEREQADREERARAAARANAEANQAGNNSGAGGSAGGTAGRGRAAAAARARGFFRGGRGGASGGPAHLMRGWSSGIGGRGGGRGYGMPPPERQGEGMASGPFGAGSVLTAGVSFCLLTLLFEVYFFVDLFIWYIILASAPFIILFRFYILCSMFYGKEKKAASIKKARAFLHFKDFCVPKGLVWG
jgi:hypothetical protein